MRVLIAEDHDMMRSLLVSAVNSLGFDLVETCSADEAINALHSTKRFDMLITDIEMPGNKDVYDLIGLAATLGLKIIVASSDTSGTPHEDTRLRTDLHTAAGSFSNIIITGKIVSVQQLRHLIKALLAIENDTDD